MKLAALQCLMVEKAQYFYSSVLCNVSTRLVQMHEMKVKPKYGSVLGLHNHRKFSRGPNFLFFLLNLFLCTLKQKSSSR